MIRTNPQAFIPYLNDMKNRFIGKTYKTYSGLYVTTTEGISGVQELINFLQVQYPITALQWYEPLAEAARYMAAI